MKWRDVEAGQQVVINGAAWKVVSRDGDAVTLLHETLGERTGSPQPGADVEVVATPRPTPAARPAPPERSGAELARYEKAVIAARNAESTDDPELTRLRAFAKSEGYRDSQVYGLTLNELKALIERDRIKKVAADNGVSEQAVEDVLVRLTLGATVIAELHTGEPPATPKVEAMDEQTMRNHLAFFHDTYPAKHLGLDELVAAHDQAKDAERHTHSVPF